jgi:hypothetical protein
LTWSYSGNPSASAKDEVRFLVGDATVGDQLLQDEEIAYCISAGGTARLGAALAAEAIAAKFSRLADRSVGQVSVSCSQKSAQYRKLALELRASDAASSVLPRFGEVERSKSDELDIDTGVIQPSFRVGMNDPPQLRERKRTRDDDGELC